MAESNKYRFKDLNVEDCFKDFYTVPDYQREYVWRAEYEVAQLLIDLYDEFSGDKTKEYFIGTTVVYDNDGQKELIDGQQRTTTLFSDALCFPESVCFKRTSYKCRRSIASECSIKRKRRRGFPTSSCITVSR